MGLTNRIEATRLFEANCLMNLKEVCAYLNCSRATIYRAMAREEEPLRGIRVNGTLRFSPEELKKHIY